MLKISVVLSSMDAQVQASLYVPLMAAILLAFPNSGEWLNLSMTVTSGVMVPSILIAGKLADYFDMKKILLIGTVLFMIGGLTCAVANSIQMIVASRFILGIGAGLAYPMVPAMVSLMFEDHERNQVLGYTNAGASIVSLALNLSAGVLCLINWRLPFVMYLLFIPILLLQLRFIPNFRPNRERIAEEKALKKTQIKEKLPLAALVVVGAMLIFSSAASIFNLKLAIFVTNDLGGTSVGTGLANSCNNIVSFLGGMTFAAIFRRLRHYTCFMSVAATAIAYFILGSANSLPVVMIGMALIGFSFGCLIPYMMAVIAEVCPKSTVTMAMSLLTMALMLGVFFTSFVLMAYEAIVGPAIRSTFYASGVFFSLCALIALATAFYLMRRRQSKKEL